MISVGAIYTSANCGDFKITRYIDCNNVHIKFIKTGYKTTIQSSQIRTRAVKDKFLPSVCGIGYIGDGDQPAYVNKIMTKQYLIWRHMLTRCYCKKYQKQQPSYIGCTVAKEWHDFQVFSKWFDLNYIEGYQIDKDIKYHGNKVYSADTCIFVSPQENSEKANAKNYKFISPNGAVEYIYNLSKFCRKNNLSQAHMSAVSTGKRKHHKGWLKYNQLGSTVAITIKSYQLCPLSI